MTRALVGALLGAQLMLGCGTPAAELRTAASARTYFYRDDAGLRVSSFAASAEVPVGAHASIDAHAELERVHISPSSDSVAVSAGIPHAGGHVHGGSSGGDVDVISSASSAARVGGDTTLFRYEGELAARAGIGSPDLPADAALEGRISSEPDYFSASATAMLRGDFFERNLVLTVSAGAGRDTITPDSAPPGERALWPAHHDRAFVSFSAAQVLDPYTLFTASLSLARQSGTLENPYRRVLVRTSLFPERVPDERLQLAASTGLARYLGHGFALHARSGFYADDWGVLALIPELALAWDAGHGLLADVHARYYAQSAARFYAPSYGAIEPERTGDVRLGPLRERSLGGYFESRLLSRSSPVGELAASLGYDLLLLDHRELGHLITGHLLALGARLTL